MGSANGVTNPLAGGLPGDRVIMGADPISFLTFNLGIEISSEATELKVKT